MPAIIILFVYMTVPVLIIYLTGRNKIANRVGAIILAYAAGIIFGHLGLVTKPSTELYQLIAEQRSLDTATVNLLIGEGRLAETDLLAYNIYKMQDLLISITIPLALPLLLFPLKIRVWLRMAGKTLISMVIALFSVVLVISLSYQLVKDEIPHANKIAGLLIGLYTGGTPNLASLKLILNVDANTYIMTHTYDTVVSVFYLIFLITGGKLLFRRFLLPYPKKSLNGLYDNIDFTEDGYKGIFRLSSLKSLAVALITSIVIVGISLVFGFLVPPAHMMLVVMLSITTLGIFASMIRFINQTEKSFELGMFFIIIFSMVIASMADAGQLMEISSSLFLFITLAIFGTLFLHVLLSKIFGVDADTVMITSTSLICSPPFVPMIAGILRNKEVVVAGLTVGIMGYAIGNYLGTLLANIL